MPALSSGPAVGQPDQRGRLRSAWPPEYLNALVVVAIAVTMASLFVASYTLALARPVPRHIPMGLVGDPAREPAVVTALEAAAQGSIEFRPYPSVPAAEAAISRQLIFGALVLGLGRPQLLISSASGASLARVLEQAAAQVSRATAVPLEVVDVRPLPPSDPLGLMPFYVVIGATILGFITMFQLRGNAPKLSLRAWLAVIGILGASGGLLITLVVDPLLGALRGPFLELWAAIASQIAVAALFCSAMLVLVPRWAMIPTWILFIAVGNAASGGAVSRPLLPALYAFVGQYLPSGAAVSIIHNAVYFRQAQQVGPLVVQCGWLVGCLAALLISARVLHRTPGGG